MHLLIIFGIIVGFYFGVPLRPWTNHLSIIDASSNDISQEFSIRSFWETNNIVPHVRWNLSQSIVTPPSSENEKERLSIETLLHSPELFHKKIVTIRGIVAQPEMHLDETELFFDFVFVLKEGTKSIVVFGRHDRTQGSSPIAMGNSVEVTGIFWKDRIAHDYHFKNNLEAVTITPYPSLTPDRT